MFSVTQYAGFGVPSASGVTPPSTPALYAWYDFSDAATLVVAGGNITTASDKSTNALHISGTSSGTRSGGPAQATINGLAAADFFAGGALAKRYLTRAGVLPNIIGGMSACLVAMTTATSAGNSTLYIIQNSTAAATPTIARFLNVQAAGTATSTLTPQIPFMDAPQPAGGTKTFGIPDAGQVIVVAGGRLNGTSTTSFSSTMRVNGNNGGTTTGAGSVSGTGTTIELSLSSPPGIGELAWPGLIGEVRFFSSPLALADMQSEEGYLAWKWGLQGSLPVGHPYKNAPP